VTNAKHTPGPWAYRDSKIVAINVRPEWADEDDVDERVCVVDLYGAMGGEDTAADARLIAEAPAMEDMLRDVLPYIKGSEVLAVVEARIRDILRRIDREGR